MPSMRSLSVKYVLRSLIPARIRTFFGFFLSTPRIRLISLLSLCIVTTILITRSYISCLPVAPYPFPTKSFHDALTESLDSVSENQLAADIGFLSHNLLEGRAPGTVGEALAVEYISAQFRANGLIPVGNDATYISKVPMTSREPSAPFSLAFAKDSIQVHGIFGDSFTAYTESDASEVTLEASEMVFVGFGISAIPYDWDDYKVDVAGRVVVMLIGEPDGTVDEPAMFAGDALTYYGRWIYKVDEARRRGARGVVMIHTEESCGYPFSVLTALRSKLLLAESPMQPLDAVVWLNEDLGHQLAALATQSLVEWRRLAQQRSFMPRVLPVQISLSMSVQVHAVNGMNVIAQLPGSGSRAHEAVLVIAHHDHLGAVPHPPTGHEEGLYNGAIDNASGVSALLAMARALVQYSKERPLSRTVLFATLTAEEHGLLGAMHYAQHPPVPLKDTVAVVNFDVTNVWGKAHDVVGLGADMCGLDDLFAQAARQEGLYVGQDPHPSSGSVYRADSWIFTLNAIPSVYIWMGEDNVDVVRARRDYVQRHYHRPSDDVRAIIDLSGTVQQVRVGARLVAALANSSVRRPQCLRGWGIPAVDNVR